MASDFSVTRPGLREGQAVGLQMRFRRWPKRPRLKQLPVLDEFRDCRLPPSATGATAAFLDWSERTCILVSSPM